MNSKGDFAELKGWIITILVLVLLVTFAAKLNSFTTSSGNTATCQASLLKATIGGEFNDNLAQLRCDDLPDIELKKSQYVSGSKINDDAIKSSITNKMLDCWKMVGKGSLFDPAQKFDDDQVYCLKCSDVIFDDDFKKFAKDNPKQVQDSLKDILFWQASHSIPNLKTTYFEELYGIKPDTTTIRAMQNTEEGSINVNEPYVVVWTFEKNQFSKAGATATIATGGAAVAFLGAKTGGVLLSWAGPLGVGVGALGGALIGGAIGAYYVWTADSVIASGIHFVPRTQLGENVQFEGKTPRPFCTKLVNR